MCLLFYEASGVGSDSDSRQKLPFKLIVANTRDEYYDRATREACVWSQTEERNFPVIAGMDVAPDRPEGTWFAVNPSSGRVAVLLNVLMPADEFRTDALGRGTLAVEALSPTKDPGSYLGELSDKPEGYNGYKLIVFEPDESKRGNYGVWHYCNVSDRGGLPFGFPSIPDSSCEVNAVKLASYGFGNNVPGRFWRKVDAGTSAFRTAVRVTSADWKSNPDMSVESARQLLTGRILAVLSNKDSYYPDQEIAIRGRGRPDEFLPPYSRIFIRMPQFKYGTRTQTVLTIDREDNAVFTEITMSDELSEDWKKTEMKFKVGGEYDPERIVITRESVPAPHR